MTTPWATKLFSGKTSCKLSLYFFRHGQSEANLSAHKLVTGRQVSSPLTSVGEQEATALGEWMKKKNINLDLYYASSAKRTIQTATFALKSFDWYKEDNLIISEDLIEIDMGDWVGTDRTKCYTEEILDQIKATPWTFAPPNGESQKDVEGS